MIKDAISERQSDVGNLEERKTNIIVFNAPESEASSMEERTLGDKAFFVETCNSFCDRNIPSTGDVLQARRLGKRVEGKDIRPLLIKLKSEMTKRVIFIQLHKLRNNESLSILSMNHYMTTEEKEKTKLLVEEAKRQTKDIMEKSKSDETSKNGFSRCGVPRGTRKSEMYVNGRKVGIDQHPQSTYTKYKITIT